MVETKEIKTSHAKQWPLILPTLEQGCKTVNLLSPASKKRCLGGSVGIDTGYELNGLGSIADKSKNISSYPVVST
jgi:hypothetical protein